MCLLTKYNVTEPSVTTEAKACYKIIKFQNGHYLTPFRDTIISELCIFEAYPFEANKKTLPWQKLISYNDDCLSIGLRIDGGYIHAYSQLETAKAELKALVSRYKGIEFFIYHCEIPSGTEYFEGINDEICARQITFKELKYSHIYMAI